MTVHFFLGNSLLASTTSPQWWTGSELTTCSLAYFCPTCGEIWARVVQPKGDWMTVNRRCKAHPDGYFPAGTLIHPWAVPLSSYPLPVLQREFLLLYEHHFKDQP